MTSMTLVGFSHILVLSLGLAIGLVWGLRRKLGHSPDTGVADEPPMQVLVFEDRALTFACKQSRQTLSPEYFEPGAEDRLIDRLEEVFPRFRENVEVAQSEATGFELFENTTDGPVKVGFSCTNGGHRYEITGLDDLGVSRVLLDRRVVAADTQELAFLRATMEATPFPVWRECRSGRIDWANRAYFDLIDKIDGVDQNVWPPARALDGGIVVRPGEIARVKRNACKLADGTTRWFDVSSFGLENASIHFASESGATVKAEEALRNFVQTLTQTFAALPVGLAIFDRKRRLALFNPALTDLTSLEPEWLAGRPTLYDFVNRLREKRMAPERKDFSDWRRHIARLEASAVGESYLETWTLPTGQTYRVKGQPHPDGAVAFIIEDVSAEISLTRKFRQELMLSQSLIDSLPEAVAVFNADGILTISNAPYCEMWGLDPEKVMQQVTILDASKDWQRDSLPTPLWGDLRDFVTQPSDRSEWGGAVDMRNGNTLSCRFAPLPGGATLVGFTKTELPKPHSTEAATPEALQELST